MITKIVCSVVISLSAALGATTPASADPSAFGPLHCHCTPPSDAQHGRLAVDNPVEQGIRSGLGSVRGGPASPSDS